MGEAHITASSQPWHEAQRGDSTDRRNRSDAPVQTRERDGVAHACL